MQIISDGISFCTHCACYIKHESWLRTCATCGTSHDVRQNDLHLHSGKWTRVATVHKTNINVAVAPLADMPATVHVGVLLSVPTLQSQHRFVEIPPACHALLVRSSQCCAMIQCNKRKTTLTAFRTPYVFHCANQQTDGLIHSWCADGSLSDTP